MTTPLLNETIGLSSNNSEKLNLYLLGYKLELATEFGTSHSSSTFRHNALLLLRVPLSQERETEAWSLKGVGEVGLPPKKEMVYEADLDDMTTYVRSFLESFQQLTCPNSAHDHIPVDSSSAVGCEVDMFAPLPKHYFARVRGGTGARVVSDNADGNTSPASPPPPPSSCTLLPYTKLLQALDTCSCNTADHPFARAGRALVESAILDAWASELRVPLYDLINVTPLSQTHRSFYTAALNADVSLIVEAAMYGAKYTPHLKIKLNASVELAQSILSALDEALPHQDGHQWSIDANAAWSPAVADRMLEVLMPYAHRIFMVEQPFPVNVHMSAGGEGGEHGGASAHDQWVDVKAKYNACDILIFADESMRTAADITLLAPIVNGVNIKLEKCGGFRGALLAVEEARELDLMVWFGCMVGSNVNSSTTAQIYSLACGSDLDGALLVTPETLLFEGGFQYTSAGNIQLCRQQEGAESSSSGGGSSYGIGVTPTVDFAKFILFGNHSDK